MIDADGTNGEQKGGSTELLKEFLDVGVDDLNMAIYLLEAARLQPSEPAMRSILVSELCAALRIQYYVNRNSEDLLSAIALMKKQFPMPPPDDSQHSQVFCALAFENLLWTRQMSGDALRSNFEDYIRWKDSVRQLIA